MIDRKTARLHGVPELEVTVLNRQRGHVVSEKGLLAFLAKLARCVPVEAADSVAVKLVSDRGMREINRDFRGLSGSTDVLSFPGEGEFAPSGERHLGDIVISVPHAAAQARRANHSLARELKLLALHGYLHLMGYDHETDDGTMLRMQRRLEHRLLAGASAGN